MPVNCRPTGYKQVTDKIEPIGYRQVTDGFLKQKVCCTTDWNRAINPINKTVYDIHLGCSAENDRTRMRMNNRMNSQYLGTDFQICVNAKQKIVRDRGPTNINCGILP